MGELKKGRVKSKRAFIISSNPNAETFFPYHKVVVVDPGIEEARRIIGAGGLADSANQSKSSFENKSDGHFFGGRGANFGVMSRLLEEWYRVRSGSAGADSGSREW